MAKHDRGVIRLDDGEDNIFHGTWSRSGKHLLVTVAPQGSWSPAVHVELTPAQLESLRRFLGETLPLSPSDR